MSGPSFIEFSNDQIENPIISNLTKGIYSIELSVSDGAYEAFDDLLIIVSETGNAKPSVGINSPVENSVFRIGEEILIEASGSDLDGNIDKICFYKGDSLLGEDFSEPFNFLWKNAREGDYNLTAVATDDSGEEGFSNGVNIRVVSVPICSETSNRSIEGSFSVGYTVTFESLENDVVVTVDLLDEDKTAVVAYLWNEEPFSEVEMDAISNSRFKTTLSGNSIGNQISVACKFAFAGGVAVTEYLQYTIGTDCSESEDTTPPRNFSVSLGSITESSIELKCLAEDDSGEIVYTIAHDGLEESTAASSGEEKSMVIDSLNSNTNYSFTILAKDRSGNEAENSPVSIEAVTLQPNDTTAPMRFMALPGLITKTSIELFFSAEDDSQEVIFDISHEAETEVVSSESGIENSLTFDELIPNTTYVFTIGVKDPSGNKAKDSPISIVANTDSELLAASTEIGNINIYPNPTQKSVTIDWKNFESVIVYNLEGVRLFKSKRNIISVENLANGIYVFELIGLDQQLIRVKILKE
ncbi:MAG: T9SS type A sorting domain-containing protein [Ekhidna sp.]|nr:T9SS type A sorting domain-containing protein [Ekhidna sp.]